MRESLGIERQTPDEFAVTPSLAPLDMPPNFYDLPEPTPGAKRPQDMDYSEQAYVELVGQKPQTSAMTSGQQALVRDADATSAQDAIRRQVDEEARLSSQDKTFVEHLGLRKEKPKGKALDSVEESERLREQGVSTPTIPKTQRD